MRQRENKPKSTVFTTVGNTRNNNPFHVTSTGNMSRTITTQVTPKFTPINFGKFVRNTNNTSNTNQSRSQTYQPTLISVTTRNSSFKPNSNINNRRSTSTMQNNFILRTNNMFKTTGSLNFISEELHYQEEQSTDFINEGESSNIEEGTIEYENE